MDDKWTFRQRMFMLWLATPKPYRDPRTQLKLADKLGVTPRTLRRWKNKPGFWPEVYAHVNVHLGERLADILNALVDKAVAGNVAAARLVLEVAGLLNSRKR